MSQRCFFPKSVRLCRQSVIDRIFRHGRYRRYGILQVKTAKCTDGASQFMISIKKKVGHAPERNRIKRLVREGIRLNQHRLQGNYHLCFFITARPQYPLEFQYVNSRIISLFEDLNAEVDHAATSMD